MPSLARSGSPLLNRLYAKGRLTQLSYGDTAVGSVAMTGNTSGTQQTFTNKSDPTNGTYPIWGTRTGVYPGTFAATLNMTSTAPVSGYYPPADQGSLTASMQGVVSGPAGGTQTGVMTTIAGGQGEGSSSWTFAGPVTINPNGSLSASFYGTNTDNSVTPAPTGIFKQSGTWSQTAQAIPSASTYNFSIPLTEADYINPTSTSQASIEPGMLKMPMYGIMCQSRSGRPMWANTNSMTMITAEIASISPSTVTSCIAL